LFAQRVCFGAQPQVPFTHAPQQSVLPLQAVPLVPHSQVPVYPQEPLQHCASDVHCAPAATQAQCPPVQVCEQQSPGCWQAAPPPPQQRPAAHWPSQHGSDGPQKSPRA
jgi:hypothetical protein